MMRLRIRRLLPLCFLACSVSMAAAADNASGSPAYRFQRGGWTYVHLEGTPAQIGFQHGQLLANEIADLIHVTKVETLHSTKRDWAFYRQAAQTELWPHIEPNTGRSSRASREAHSRKASSSTCGISLP